MPRPCAAPGQALASPGDFGVVGPLSQALRGCHGTGSGRAFWDDCALSQGEPSAGSALSANPVTVLAGRHDAWPSSRPPAATIGALVLLAGMVSDMNGAPRPPAGNRRSGVPNLRPDRSDRVISRPLELVGGPAPRQIAIPDLASRGQGRKIRASVPLCSKRANGLRTPSAVEDQVRVSPL